MRKIEWTNRAKTEFDNTFNFWINHNKSDSYSEKLLDETLRKINIIAENPFVGEVVSRNSRRVLVLENFSIVYRTTNNTIKINAFFDNRRNPNSL